jgi:hypothetical protein
VWIQREELFCNPIEKPALIVPNQSWVCTNRSGLLLAPSRVAGRKLIHDPQVPLTDPIRDLVSGERGAFRDHLAQVLCRPVLVIIYEQFGFAIRIDIGIRGLCCKKGCVAKIVRMR